MCDPALLCNVKSFMLSTPFFNQLKNLWMFFVYTQKNLIWCSVLSPFPSTHILAKPLWLNSNTVIIKGNIDHTTGDDYSLFNWDRWIAMKDSWGKNKNWQHDMPEKKGILMADHVGTVSEQYGLRWIIMVTVREFLGHESYEVSL